MNANQAVDMTLANYTLSSLSLPWSNITVGALHMPLTNYSLFISMRSVVNESYDYNLTSTWAPFVYVHRLVASTNVTFVVARLSLTGNASYTDTAFQVAFQLVAMVRARLTHAGLS